MARYMHVEVPGTVIPEPVMNRMAAEEKGSTMEEGKQITLALIEKIRLPGVFHGIHIMTIGWEEIVLRII